METEYCIKRQWITALALLALICFADQVTKHIIDVKLPIQEIVQQGPDGRSYYAYSYVKGSDSWNITDLEKGSGITIIPGFLYIVHVVNKGAAWGSFHGKMDMLGWISFLALIAMLVFFRKICEDYKERVIGLGLLMGGTLGNLIDRADLISRGNDIHGVIDFISIQVRKINYEYPSFNIADMGICVGVALICISSFLRPEKGSDKEAPFVRLKKFLSGKREEKTS